MAAASGDFEVSATSWPMRREGGKGVPIELVDPSHRWVLRCHCLA